MGPGDVFSLLVAMLIPAIVIIFIASRMFRLREKRLEIEAGMAAEKAAQYASRSSELEQRLRVIEQIITDNGAQTAAQIEALRDRPALARSPKADPATQEDAQ